MNKISKKVLKYFMPAFIFLLCFSYIRLVSNITLKTDINVLLFSFMGIPLLIYPFMHFFSMQKDRSRLLNYSGLIISVLFWSFLYYAWGYEMSRPDKRIHMELIYYFFVPNLQLIFIAESYLSFIAFSAALMFYLFSVKLNRFYILSIVILPAVLTYMLFCHFYYMGGLYAHREELITDQPGMDILFRPQDFPKNDYFDYTEWISGISEYPRKVIIDSMNNCLFVNYAQTFGSVQKKRPGLLQIGLDSGKVLYYKSFYNRSFALAGDELLVSPWHEYAVLSLDPLSLREKRRIESQVDLDSWETVDICWNEKKSVFHVSNEVDPMLMRYDLKSGRLLKSYRPSFMKNGGFMWNLELSSEKNELYFIASNAEDDLYKIDSRDYSYKDSLGLDTFGASALELDEESGSLFVQDGHSDRLFVVDASSFSIVKTLKGSMHSRSLKKDPDRDVIYVLSFLNGNLYALDIKSGKRLWSRKTASRACGLDIYDDKLYIAAPSGIFIADLEFLFNEGKSR